jgi:sporulation-control protein
MVFKQMLSAFGVGGPSVDTMLVNPNIRPGLALDGQVSLRGGDSPVKIEQVTLALVTRVEEHGGDTGYAGGVEFHRMPVSGPLHLDAGQELSIPFQLPVPWEIPITDVYGQRLRGMAMGLRTEVAVARAVDRSDLDQIAVHPLPVQERILDAFARLGFRFKNADLEHGRIYGVQQTLPFYQEIEFFAAPQYAHAIREVELTFIANQYTVDVIIECDRRGGMFTGGHDSVGRYVVAHAQADNVDWTWQVDAWLGQAVAHYTSAGQFPGGSHHGHGPGMGGMVGGAVAGAAVGFVGGMVAGEVLDEMLEGEEGFFGDE